MLPSQEALLESASYDESGQLVSGSYMDYSMPRADTLPEMKIVTSETPCPHNPLGVKGCGEAGAISAPAFSYHHAEIVSTNSGKFQYSSAQSNCVE